MKVKAPFGSWKSPISAADLVKDTIRLSDASFDGETIYWIESRPNEGGRYVIVQRTPDGQKRDVLPAPFNARTLVHEYGGGNMLVHKGTVYFSNYEDQRIYSLIPGEQPQPLTAASKERFADYTLDSQRNRLIAIRENHDVPKGKQAVNDLVAVSLEDGNIQILHSGYDFYAAPRINPAGSQIAWICWMHPNMPWDATALMTADLNPDGSIKEIKTHVEEPTESIFQPEYAPDGTLHYVSDRSGWWNLYKISDAEHKAIHPLEAEFGVPHWSFGSATYGFNDQRLIATYGQKGIWKLAGFDDKTSTLVNYQLPYTAIGRLRIQGNQALFFAGSPARANELVLMNLTTGMHEVLVRSEDVESDPAITSVPETIEFPTDDNDIAHAFYYPPKNDAYEAPEGTAPPLITIIHGGPTSASNAVFSLQVQYWTSRGFAVIDVNHRGSTGYGRAFRDALKDRWGIVDVADAANGALYLAEQGKADRDKLIIRGGSAGGYTTLAALTFKDVFRAGASYYGISDLIVLAQDTHKFESRYPDHLLGPYPEAKAIYEKRSPINNLDGFDQPVILLQGLEDKVVPPNQSELILEALKKKGVQVAYLPFEGEQHGFRKAENIIRAREAELYFYSKVFGFELSEDIKPINIHNL